MKYFGTDGIRGRAGEGKLSKPQIGQIGLALGKMIARQKSGGRAVIGRDTRRSGDWIENLLVTGLISHGIDVILLGVLPTAATSFLTSKLGADLGIMITASHNPYHDNGVKFFGPDGRKLGENDQDSLEKLMTQSLSFPDNIDMGTVERADQHKHTYINLLTKTLAPKSKFNDLSIVLDCAHGAAFETAPDIIRQLEPKALHVIGARPDGVNINKNCGSTHPELMCEAVRNHGADIGVALDGDADRLIMCDEKGQVIDGDQIMAALALDWKSKGKLRGESLVATVMSNLGLERLMLQNDLKLLRTKVGDRYVAAAMKSGGYNLGGEQSGHLLMPDYLPTGDGMLAAIQVMSVLAESSCPASETLKLFTAAPQLLVNVRYEGASPLDKPIVKTAIAKAEEKFGDQGRVLIRVSGTEPVIRVMTEGDNADDVKSIAHELADIIKENS